MGVGEGLSSDVASGQDAGVSHVLHEDGKFFEGVVGIGGALEHEHGEHFGKMVVEVGLSGGVLDGHLHEHIFELGEGLFLAESL